MKRGIWTSWRQWTPLRGLSAGPRLRLSSGWLRFWVDLRDKRGLEEFTQGDESRWPGDLIHETVVASIVRWLSEDEARSLPLPEDGAGIKELAQATGKNEVHIKYVLAWAYGEILVPHQRRSPDSLSAS